MARPVAPRPSGTLRGGAPSPQRTCTPQLTRSVHDARRRSSTQRRIPRRLDLHWPAGTPPCSALRKCCCNCATLRTGANGSDAGPSEWRRREALLCFFTQRAYFNRATVPTC